MDNPAGADAYKPAALIVDGAFVGGAATGPQGVVHLDDPRFQLRREFFVCGLRSLRFRRRHNRLAELHAQRRQLLEETLAARPDLEETLNCHWDNRHLQMNRQDRSALLEYSWSTVNGALAL